ncbi:hypothetical protein MLD38_011806 [Melastoma candidum]|uniref:Uncharacterized protein n=1 Tax=Melastoma candidum TaxID=119954 RepID=A0ACB9R7T3_9MYRT|nr:hypothetical protein MLD38_011806 [Melastoma candidum]
MGVSFSSLPSQPNDVQRAIGSILVKALLVGNDDPLSLEKSGRGLDGDSGFLAGDQEFQCLVNFDGRNSEMVASVETPQKSMELAKEVTLLGPDHPRHEAAVKLQKVYKSFRTRRKLADCAVLVQQSWWKLLDFAELKHSSVSFFDGEKHETAISRWSRARTRAAKVGKGLSKNDKAQKLALQHWLEARLLTLVLFTLDSLQIDPRHRYGHNLHFYYKKWLQSQSREPFFYWLDIGEGKEVNLEKCPRSKLQQQCIKYLGPMERKAYEIVIVGGKLYYRQSGELLDTTAEPSAKWIFVLSTSKVMYVSKKKKGSFQHSSFLAGGAASAAGRLIVDKGIVQAVWPHSGHYRPTEENFKDFISFLRDNDVDLSDAKLSPEETDTDDNMSHSRQNSMSDLQSVPSKDDMMLEVPATGVDSHGALSSVDYSESETLSTDLQPPSRGQVTSFSDKLTSLMIPRSEIIQRTDSGRLFLKANTDDSILECNMETNGNPTDSKQLQLGNQSSCKWTTGAGARIGYVRDHPQKLQVRALEHVNLSPRTDRRCSSQQSPGRLFVPASPRLI